MTIDLVEAIWTLLRFTVGCFFVWSAAVKLQDLQRFWQRIANYELSPPLVTKLLAAAIPPVELLAGLQFAAGINARAAGLILAALLLIFTTAMVIRLVRGAEHDCGCGKNEHPLSWALVGRNISIGAALVVSYMNVSTEFLSEPLVAGTTCLVAIFISIAVFQSLSLRLKGEEHVNSPGDD